MKIHFTDTEAYAFKNLIASLEPLADFSDAQNSINKSKLVTVHNHEDGSVVISLRSGLLADLLKAMTPMMTSIYNLGKAMGGIIVSYVEAVQEVLEKHTKEAEEEDLKF